MTVMVCMYYIIFYQVLNTPHIKFIGGLFRDVGPTGISHFEIDFPFR